MFPLDIVPDPAKIERDALRTNLRNSLGIITGRAQLLQRQVLRSTGLISADRDDLLEGLTAVLAEVERVGAQVEDLVTSDTPYLNRRSAPFPVLPVPAAVARQTQPLIPLHQRAFEPAADRGLE